MDKILPFQRVEAHNMAKRLIHLYEGWKIQAHEVREQLKSDIPHSQIAALIDTLEKGRDNVTDIYTEIRNHPTHPMRQDIESMPVRQ